MKTELKLAEHSQLPGHSVIEIWYDGEFIGQICGADGPGIRVISKHPILPGSLVPVGILEVRINPKGQQ